MRGGRRVVSSLLVIGIVIGCAPAPSALPSASATPGIPILSGDVAVATAEGLAEIGGPFQVDDVVGGRFADLDPMSHNNPGDLGEADRLRRIADRAAWSVTLRGPNGSEVLVIDAETGELLGATTQGS